MIPYFVSVSVSGFRIPDSGFRLLVLPPIVSNMAGVEHAGVKGGNFIVVNHVSETKETITYEPAESLLFQDEPRGKNIAQSFLFTLAKIMITLYSSEPFFFCICGQKMLIND